MSRDFIASTPGREFKKSPNRDRITRGVSAAELFYTGLIYSGEEYSREGVDNPPDVIYLTPVLPPSFPFPEFGFIDSRSFLTQNLIQNSIDQRFVEPVELVIGRIYTFELEVAGLCELYNPQADINRTEVVLQQSTIFNGTQIDFTTTYSEFERALPCGLTVQGFGFRPVTDKVTTDPFPVFVNGGGALLTSKWDGAEESGKALLINTGEEVGVVSIHRRIRASARLFEVPVVSSKRTSARFYRMRHLAVTKDQNGNSVYNLSGDFSVRNAAINPINPLNGQPMIPNPPPGAPSFATWQPWNSQWMTGRITAFYAAPGNQHHDTVITEITEPA